jgi:hypothetical protein
MSVIRQGDGSADKLFNGPISVLAYFGFIPFSRWFDKQNP